MQNHITYLQQFCWVCEWKYPRKACTYNFCDHTQSLQLALTYAAMDQHGIHSQHFCSSWQKNSTLIHRTKAAGTAYESQLTPIEWKDTTLILVNVQLVNNMKGSLQGQETS